MASFKESSLSRPLPQSGIAVRQNNPKHHSHSISLGAVNSNHRVTRRKSVTTTAAANAAAAVAATLKDNNTESPGIPMAPSSHCRIVNGRKGLESSSLGTGSTFSSYLSRSMNSAGHSHSVQKASPNPGEASAAEVSSVDKSSSKSRNRRASEGSHLVKGEGKRSSVPELRCERCGKGYKHGSCLSKHMWEHDPAWAVTSKLLISKHQQVQLLEAATVLVNMNQDAVPGDPPESEASSASPDASSELRDGLSSAETTPPPIDDSDDFDMSDMPPSFDKRFSVSNASGGYAHSYQSIPSSSFTGGGLHSPAFSHFRHSSIDTRPSTAETKLPDDDEADLAAAIRLCNFGTPRTGPIAMSSDIPPVPPLPARFLDQTGTSHLSNGFSQSGTSAADATAIPGSTPSLFPSLSFNPSLSYKVSDEREARMGDSDRELRHRRNNDVDFGSRYAHADDDDDGVFGRMEE